MSIDHISWVLRSCRGYSPVDRVVLIVIGDCIPPGDEDAYPSLRTIAERADVHTSTVVESIHRLEEAGELVVVRPERRGRGHHNRYFMVMGRDPDDLARRVGLTKKGSGRTTLSPSSARSRPLRAGDASGSHTEGPDESGDDSSEDEKGSGRTTLSPVDNGGSDPEEKVVSPDASGSIKARKRVGKGRPRPALNHLIIESKPMAMAMETATPVEKPESPPAAGTDTDRHPPLLAVVATALDEADRKRLWAEGPRGRAALAARLEALALGGWTPAELVAELARPLPPGHRSVTAVVLARARALDRVPPRLVAEQLDSAEAEDARARQLQAAALHAWRLAHIDELDPADVDELVGQIYGADPEALASAMRALVACRAGEAMPEVPTPGGDHR